MSLKFYNNPSWIKLILKFDWFDMMANIIYVW